MSGGNMSGGNFTITHTGILPPQENHIVQFLNGNFINFIYKTLNWCKVSAKPISFCLLGFKILSFVEHISYTKPTQVVQTRPMICVWV